MRRSIIVAMSIMVFWATKANSAVPVEVLSHLGSHERSYSIAVDGNHAYWSTNNALVVLDISQSSRPAQTGRVDVDYDITGIEARDNLVFCAANRDGLLIVDVSNLARPQVIGHCLTEFACDVKLNGNYAYVADGEQCLRVIDISNPNEPNLIASCKPNGLYVFGHHIAVANGIAYVTDEFYKKIYVIDISLPASPAIITTYNLPDYTHGIAVRGNYAYLANSQTGLNIIDISNPSEPNSIAICDTPGYAYGVTLAGDYALVSDSISEDSYSGRLNLINIYDPYHPRLVSSYQTGRYAYRLAVRDNLAFVVNMDRGFDIVDFSEWFRLSLKGYFMMSRAARSVNIVGNTACLVDEYTGTHFFDISNPSAPACFGGYAPYGYDTPHYISSTIVGDYAYIAWGGEALDVVKIYDPVKPVFWCRNNFRDMVNRIRAEGDILYAAIGQCGLEMMDFSVVPWGDYLGSYDTNGTAMNFVKDGNNVYIADGSSGLKIIDVANPANPALLGACGTDGLAYGVALANDFAVIADYSAGVKTIDVSDPCNPALVGSCSTPGMALDIAAAGTLACVADGSGGLQIVDVSAKSTPDIVSSFAMPDSAIAIEAIRKVAIVADGTGGFFIFRIGLPGDLEPDGDVDINDLARFCVNWLGRNCEKPYGCGNADINNDGVIDFRDFAMLSQNWQEKP